MEEDGEGLPASSARPELAPEEPAAKKRGRPKKKAKKNKCSDAQSEEPAKPPAPKQAQPKQKAQCMGCGKVFERKLMANLRYCQGDKSITDRLYHAAKAQGETKWLSEQLSTLEGSTRLVSAYKIRFPDWKIARSSCKTFVTVQRDGPS